MMDGCGHVPGSLAGRRLLLCTFQMMFIISLSDNGPLVASGAHFFHHAGAKAGFVGCDRLCSTTVMHFGENEMIHNSAVCAIYGRGDRFCRQH
ncbi:MAG: hypothetical protein ACJA0B_000834 [Alcanivorax borkumensis]|jgi:hypothetical protein